jgi:flagellar biosynthetic protein FliO
LNYFNLVFAFIAHFEKAARQLLRYGLVFVTFCGKINASYSQESIALASAASDYISSILLIFLGLVCAATVWFVWRKRKISTSGIDYRLQIVGSTAFSAKERIVLIKVRDRIMMLGITAHQINLIKEFSEVDFLIAENEIYKATATSNSESLPTLQKNTVKPEN